MRFVSKERLEGVLGEIPKQNVSLFSYSLVYGKAGRESREAEERKRVQDNYMGYFELCRMGAFIHPTSSFARRPYE